VDDSSRFRFGPFLLSPRQRLLLRDQAEVPLIPRYFDLLVLLVSRRHEAVHRSDIFSTVWSDVVVSDGALTQAIRALRRALGDDPREPQFIRTHSRHGYRFVHPHVVEEPDNGTLAADHVPADRAAAAPVSPAQLAGEGDTPPGAASAGNPRPGGSVTAEPSLDALLERLCAADATGEERLDIAARLHQAGTARALGKLGTRRGHHLARAALRDARWDVPGAGEVPLFGAHGGWRAALALARLRAKRAWRLAGDRWAGGIAGTALAGILAGAAGGLVLWMTPGASARPTASVVLAVIGAIAGVAGAAGIGGGIASAEALSRSRREAAIAIGAAVGGLVAGSLAHIVVRWTLDALVGVRPGPIGGPIEGLVLGLAAGAGYAWATRGLPGGGLAAPRGRSRLAGAAQVAAWCAIAALVLGALGRPMVGGTVNAIARASQASDLALTPIARATGEPEYGPVTAAGLGAVEGAFFGCGLAWGLTRRRRVRD
jgi:DNA-binding winged helix-turn-helix (wHTH) protein